MGREIKFRAWDSKYECMDYNFFISNLGGVFGEPEKYYDTPNMEIDEAQSLTVMQYTGLKDKNGKELYEGDICKCNYFNGSKVKQHNEVVEFKNGQFELTWTINKLFKSFRSRSCFHGHPDAFEIIGNIYENPELLKANK